MITAFFYRFLDEFFYIEQLHPFATELDKVCNLKKTLYTKTGTSCLVQDPLLISEEARICTTLTKPWNIHLKRQTAFYSYLRR